jgi:hypothetical protein
MLPLLLKLKQSHLIKLGIYDHYTRRVEVCLKRRQESVIPIIYLMILSPSPLRTTPSKMMKGLIILTIIIGRYREPYCTGLHHHRLARIEN